MSPKKSKEFIKPTADSLGISEAIVDDVVSFYWSSVRKGLSDLESPSIIIANLGTFKARYKKILSLENKYQYYLDNMSIENMTFNKHAIQKLAYTKLDSLRKMKEKMEGEYQRRLETKQKRLQYVSNKNLEGERENMGGSKEQDL